MREGKSSQSSLWDKFVDERNVSVGAGSSLMTDTP